MAKQTYTVGQILTAAQMTTLQANDYNQTVSAKVASYTLVASDAGTRITMSNAAATTITVNTALFAAGDTLIITNIGAGVCTITAGTATVSTSGSLALAQYDTGTLYFTSTGVSIWNGANPGDITGVTAGTGISGGGTSGTVTVSIDTAVTVDKTTAQTLTNKTLTSPALTTPTISTLTTAGDTVYGTGSGVLSRLGIGTAGQVLTVNSGATAPQWSTAASGGGMTLINSGGTTLTGSSVSIGSIPATYKMLILMIDAAGTAQDGTVIRCTFNADSNSRYRTLQMGLGDTISTFAQAFIQLQINMDDTVQKGFSYTVLPNYASTTSWKFAQIWSMSTDNTTDTSLGMGNYSGFYNQTTAISSIELFQNGGYNFDAGKAYLYGVN